jgi:hypothetical protein
MEESLAGDDFLADESQFMCLDETNKNEHTHARRYGHVYSGDQMELKDVFVRGDRHSLVAALSVDGYIAAEVFGSKFDFDEFSESSRNALCVVYFSYINTVLERSLITSSFRK